MTKLKAMKITQNSKDFYFTLIESTILKKICFVSRVEEDIEKGFQRHLNEYRAKEIAKYLDHEGSVIPSPIILSAQSISEFNFDENTSEVSFLEKDKSFLVIDGQHRLFGLFKIPRTIKFPVIIFDELNLEDEASLFVDINTNQKGVPSSLLLAIKHLTGKESNIEELLRILFDRINNETILAGYLSSSHASPGKISRKTFNEAMKNILIAGPLADKKEDIIISILSNYFETIEEIARNTEYSGFKLYRALYFRSFLEIFNDVSTKVLTENNNLKKESFYETLLPITKIDFDRYSGNSFSTQKQLVNDLKREIFNYKSIDEIEF